MQSILLLLLLLATGTAVDAQHWRAVLSAGGATPVLLSYSKFTRPPRLYTNDSIIELPEGRGVLQPVVGLKVMWRDSVFEYGIGAQMHRIVFSGGGDINGVPVTQRIILASPAIPITAIANYCHHRGKENGYIGVNAGVVYALGKNMRDAQGMRITEDFDVYFHDGLVGYTFGIQLGYRRTFGRFDVGWQLAGSFMHLSVTQGVSNHPYTYKVLTLPVQMFVGYSF
jgi:hypothetical protein